MRLLIVDDDENGLLVLGRSLQHYGYVVDMAINGRLALQQAKQHSPDLILSDILMPEMDGFELCRHIKKDSKLKKTPFIFYTATYTDPEARALAVSLGAAHLIIKPAPFDKLLALINKTLEEKQLKQLTQTNTNVDIDHLDATERHETLLTRKLAKKVKLLEEERHEFALAHDKLKLMHNETIQRLTLASEYKDNETGNHMRRVGLYCEFIAQTLGMDSTFIEEIYYAAPMHDLGKAGIPDSILLKQGPLDKDEWEILKIHPKIGADILGKSDSSYLRMAEDIAYTHHEKWDGTGYPRGLKGEEIPLSGRIMILADQYDALRSERPYKHALEHEEVMKIMIEGDDRTLPEHFDPKILEIFKKNHTIFNDIYVSIMD